MSQSSNLYLIPIEINIDKKINILLTNVIKMLTNRKLLKESNLEKNIERIIESKNDDLIFDIKLDDTNFYYPNDKNILSLKILNQKISSINKGSPIYEFLNNKIENPKIIILNGIQGKAKEQLLNYYQFTEIFIEHELMINIIEYVAFPKHELLNNEEAQKVLEEYNVKKKEMPKILSNDPASRYFNAKPNQIFRIIRPSENTGISVSYRLVVKGNMNS